MLMYALIIVVVFIFIVAVIVYLEYRNEKAYQAEREKRKVERKKTKAPYDPKAKVQKPHLEKKEKEAKRKASTPGAKEKPQEKKERGNTDAYALKDDTKYVKKVPSAKELRETEEQENLEALKLEEKRLEAEITKAIDLPECKYPKFDYSRLVGMGLSENEAVEFIQELIPQIETQIPLIQEAMDKEDFYSMERLTHSIKGSSTTVGSGGVSDLLVAYNTYLKTGEEIEIAKEYQKYLKHYCAELKTQYAA